MSSPSVSIELRDRHDGQEPGEHRDRLGHAVPHAPHAEDSTVTLLLWETHVVEHERRVSRVLALLGIQVQFFMSSSITAAGVPHTILACSIMLELVGLFVNLSFPHLGGRQSSPTLSSIVRGTLMFPTIAGVLGLATTVIIIMAKTCLGAAIAMSCTVILGGFVYLSFLWFNVRRQGI